jgi:hypothetical protein
MQVNWSETKPGIEVPAKPPGTWTLAYDYLKGPALVMITAEGTWEYGSGKACGPDGDLNALLAADHALLAKSPVGALIAKIGGSTAGANDGAVYVVGSSAVLSIDANIEGPLYLTINDHLTGLSDNTGSVKATVKIAPQPTPSGAAGATS